MLLSKFQTLVHTLGDIDGMPTQSKVILPFNLMITRDWMKLVLRSAPSYASISLNGMGFAGVFNVRSKVLVNQIKDLSPLKILQGIGVPRK